ncbi:MAG: hypothetical protein EB145_12275, partial [Proteobacteria bacterium]|nr:hypothetical protein [Pseudomonadota bacterium]
VSSSSTVKCDGAIVLEDIAGMAILVKSCRVKLRHAHVDKKSSATIVPSGVKNTRSGVGVAGRLPRSLPGIAIPFNELHSI